MARLHRCVLLSFSASLLLWFSVASTALAEKSKADVGLIYGPGVSYFLTAPDGWIMDSESGARQGVYVTFYPKGSSWENGAAVIYSSTLERKGKTVDQTINEDIDRMRQHGLVFKVSDGGTLDTADGKKAIVKYFSGDRLGYLEAMSYMTEKSVLVSIVLHARTKTDYDAALPYFRKITNSYRFLSDNVKVEGSKH